MVAIFSRNCQLPTATDATATANRCWFLREALLSAGWSENSNNGDAAWASASNVVLTAVSGVNGLDVSAAYPRQVKSPNGDFLASHVGLILNLDSSNDRNRGLWRIATYIDANTVEVEAVGWFPQGWVTESDIGARVTTGVGVVLSNGAWTLLDAPAGSNVQIRILYTDPSNCYVYVRPRGKLADPTEVGSVTLGAFYRRHQCFNLYFDGADGVIVIPYLISNSQVYDVAMIGFGSLLDVDAADTDPVFLLSHNALSGVGLYAVSLRMLDSALAQIEAYTTTLKTGTGASIATAGVDLYGNFARRLLGEANLASVRSPWVCLANTTSVGACVRGRLPIVRVTYTGFEEFTPLDAAGDWQHVGAGIVVPRNGPNDPLLARPNPGL